MPHSQCEQCVTGVGLPIPINPTAWEMGGLPPDGLRYKTSEERGVGYERIWKLL